MMTSTPKIIRVYCDASYNRERDTENVIEF